MHREDLNLAKQRLKSKNLALAIAKQGRVIFETQSHGISGLLKAIKELDKKMTDSSVADKILGRAAALLCVYSGVIAVFAVTASEWGIEVLRDNHVYHEFENRVPHILNSKKEDVCPFEKMAARFSNPKEAYKEFKAACGQRNLI